jgi:hypothetical protein
VRELKQVDAMMDRAWKRGLSSRNWTVMRSSVQRVLEGSFIIGNTKYVPEQFSSFDVGVFRQRADEMIQRAALAFSQKYSEVDRRHGSDMTAALYLLFFDEDDDVTRRVIKRGVPARIARRAAYFDIPMAAARRAQEIVSTDDSARDLVASFPSRSSLAAQTEARRALNLGIADSAVMEGRSSIPSMNPTKPFTREVSYPLWEIREIMDRRTRGNPHGDFPEGSHWQVNGYVNTMEEIIRQDLVPPCGWNCRAALVPVSFGKAERLGLIDAGGDPIPEKIAEYNSARQPYIDNGLYPDPGFR